MEWFKKQGFSIKALLILVAIGVIGFGVLGLANVGLVTDDTAVSDFAPEYRFELEILDATDGVNSEHKSSYAQNDNFVAAIKVKDPLDENPFFGVVELTYNPDSFAIVDFSSQTGILAASEEESEGSLKLEFAKSSGQSFDDGEAVYVVRFQNITPETLVETIRIAGGSTIGRSEVGVEDQIIQTPETVLPVQLGDPNQLVSDGVNQLPIGKIEAIEQDGTLKGWAFDPDSITEMYDISVYANLLGQPKEEALLVADNIINNQSKEPIIRLWNGDEQFVGFTANVPGSYFDGQVYEFWLEMTDPDNLSEVTTTADNPYIFSKPQLVADNVPPLGEILRVQEGTITGWTYDPNSLDTVAIHVYAAKPEDLVIDGSPAGIISAGEADADNALFNLGRDSFFNYQVPAQYIEEGFAIRIFAIDTSGDPAFNIELTNEPIVFTADEVAPVGKLDGISETGLITGYATDVTRDEPVPVHLYATRPGDAINFETDRVDGGDILADTSYSVAGPYEGQAVGFTYQIPFRYLDNTDWVFTAFAIDDQLPELNREIGTTNPFSYKNNVSEGAVDGISSDGTITGWADDLGAQSPTPVHVYAVREGEELDFSESQIATYDVVANQPYSGLTAERTGQNVGFTYQLDPAQYRDGTTYSVYVYSIDNLFQQEGNAQLANTPLEFRYDESNVNNKPTGLVTYDTETSEIKGVAMDPDTAEPIYVHVYATPVGESLDFGTDRIGGDLLANQTVAIATDSSYEGKGFSLYLPDFITENLEVDYNIHVFAIDSTSTGPADNTLLPNSPLRYVPIATSNQPPVGSVQIDDTGKMQGWAYDPNTEDPIRVHVYAVLAGQPLEFTQGQLVTDLIIADDVDVTGGADVTRTVGFGYQLPSEYLNDSTYDIYVYAIDHLAQNTELNTLLNGEPLQFTFNSNANQAPDGSILDITATGFLRGWASDPDTTDAINVHLYATPVGQEFSFENDYAGSTLADNGGVYASGDEESDGFTFDLANYKDPSQYPNGVVLRAFAIDNEFDVTKNRELAGSPITYKYEQSILPEGVLDNVSTTGLIEGWALDPDFPQGVTVRLTITDENNITEDLAFVGTEISRSEIQTQYNVDYSVGFEYQITNERFFNGGTYQIRAYAIDWQNSALVAELEDSPITVTLENRSSGQSPVGEVLSVDEGTGLGVVDGWAYDPDVTDPILVHFYLREPGETGLGRWLGDTVASGVDEGDLSGTGRDVGFEFQLPIGDPSFSDISWYNTEYELVVYGIDTTGEVVNNAELQGSPYPFVLPEPTGNQSPNGEFIRIEDDTYAVGWADDPNTVSPVLINFYVKAEGETEGLGIFVGSTFSGAEVEDGTSTGFTEEQLNHYFTFEIPRAQLLEEYAAGTTLSLHAYAIDLDNNNQNDESKNIELPGSPKSFVLQEVGTNDNIAPEGKLAGITQSGIVEGWALDQNSENPVLVHLYVKKTTEPWGAEVRVTPDDFNAGLGASLVSIDPYTEGDRNFSFPLPDQYLDGVERHLIAYAIDITPQGGNDPAFNRQLIGSPIAFTRVKDDTGNNFEPVGELWPATDGGFIAGWAFDADKTSSLSVRLKIKEAGSSTEPELFAAITADEPEAEIQELLGASYNVGFNYTVPAQYRSQIGVDFEIYAYALDNGQEYLLNGSPRPYTPVKEDDPNNLDPVGALTSVENNGLSNGSAKGWAYDPDGDGSIFIKAYVKTNPEASGRGIPIFTGDGILANKPNTEKQTELGVSYNVGFSFPIPAEYMNIPNSELIVFAVDSQDPTKEVQITGSPYPLADSNNKPIGSFQGLTSAGNAIGWAWDPDGNGTTVKVHIFMKKRNTPGLGDRVAIINADKAYPAKQEELGINQNILFNANIVDSLPNKFKIDGEIYEVYALAQDTQDPNSFTLLNSRGQAKQWEYDRERVGDGGGGQEPPPIEVVGEDVVVYRFFNRINGSHLYTSAVNERDDVITKLSDIYIYEGPKFRVFPSQLPGTVPVYRFYNTANGAHIYTIAENEKRDIQNNLPRFNYEGIKYYVYPDQVEGTMPVHRFFNTTNGAHIYTDAENERRDIDNNLPQFLYEGIKFYVRPL